MDTNTFDINNKTNNSSPPEPKTTCRSGKKLYWQKIERYWEEQTLKRNLEDIFFQPTDHDTLI